MNNCLERDRFDIGAGSVTPGISIRLRTAGYLGRPNHYLAAICLIERWAGVQRSWFSDRSTREKITSIIIRNGHITGARR